MAFQALLYIVFITVQQPQNHFSSVVLQVAEVLDAGVPGVTILQAAKVSGQADFVAFVEVQNNGGLDALSRRLWSVGDVLVRNSPVIDGNIFAQNLGVSENLTSSNRSLESERLFLEEIVVDQDEKSIEEVLNLLRQQFELLLTLRSRGELSIVLYKAFESNKIYTLVNIVDVPEYDLQMNFFPLRLDNRFEVDVVVKGLQFVRDYIDSNQ